MQISSNISKRKCHKSQFETQKDNKHQLGHINCYIVKKREHEQKLLLQPVTS